MPRPPAVCMTREPPFERWHLLPRHRDSAEQDVSPLASLVQRHDCVEGLQESGIGLAGGPEAWRPGCPLSPLIGLRKNQLFNQREAPGAEPVQSLFDAP
eukprot:2318575-Rhodomonas_salina.1